MAKIERDGMTQTDSKGNVIREPRDNSSGEAVNFRWWKLDEKDMAPAIAATLRFIQRHQSNRIEQLTVSTRLYGHNSAHNLMGTAFTRASSINSNPASQRISFNLCQSVVDTLVSRMAKNKVIPTFVTNGGIWEIQKKAKNLTKFAQGFCYSEHVHDKTIEAFKDAAVWGDGFVHVFEKNNKCVVERVLPHELFVDQIESLTSEPHQLHRVKIVDRDIAMEQFPELEEFIKTVSPANYHDIGGQGTAVDLITVIESWHLRSGPDAKDGVHVISIGDGALCEEYKKDYFPFPHFRYSKGLLGWNGQGAVERLQTIQGEINRGMILKQRSLWMQGSFKVLVEQGSKVVAQHLNNDVGAIIHYTGAAPQYITPPATNPELQQWIDSLIMKGYQQEGVSQMAASAQKPIGVNSGKAMRTLTDIESDRFAFMAQQLEEFPLEICRQAIDVVKEIYGRTGKYEVTFPTTNFMETVDWKDINLDESQYVLKAYPTSSLSEDIAGRLSDIQELMQAGLVSPRTGKRLMDMPDVEMNETLDNAPEDLLHHTFEDMLDDGIYRAPEPTMDLQLAKQLVLLYVNYAYNHNCPQDRINMLLQFNQQIDDTQAQMAQEAANQAAAQQMAAQAQAQPMANPTATPTSNLIPNVQGA